MENIIEQLLEFPWTFILIYDPSDGLADQWFIQVKELPGCMSQGTDHNNAVEMIRDAMKGWLTIELRDKIDFDLPDLD